MNYENIIDILVAEFPSIKKDLEENNYMQGLPHLVFGIIFVSKIRNFCEMKDTLNLRKTGELIERMLSSDDIKTKEVADVSILEPIVFGGRDIIITLKDFLYSKGLESLNFWEERFKKSRSGI